MQDWHQFHKFDTMFVNEFEIFGVVFALFLFYVSYTYSQTCAGPSKTILAASGIQSSVLYEYLALLECRSDETWNEWEACVALCMQNSTCVGIKSNSPCETCVFANITRAGPGIINDYFLVVKNLKEFESK